MTLSEFLDASPSPYHAVASLRATLSASGFSELDEGRPWQVSPGRSYFVVRGGKSIVAWSCGEDDVARSGIRMVAAHTDSPALKLRAAPTRKTRSADVLAPEVYGGALLHTWLDRDLKIAGRVYLADGPSSSITGRLVDLPGLPVRAVSLAPHLKTDKRVEGVTINPETDLLLLWSGAKAGDEFLRALLAAANMPAADVVEHDLYLADLEPARVVGAEQAWLSAPRLDNLFSCYCAVEALRDSAHEKAPQTRLAACFDAEEIGSQTMLGARSNLMGSVIARLTRGLSRENAPECTAANSVCISLDMAHADHPAFPESMDPQHAPVLNGGPAIKRGARGNYAQSPWLAAWFAKLCGTHDVPVQRFMYRCDHGAGSSIGPLVSTVTGIPTIDVGVAMLSMHSIRELCGLRDVAHMTRALRAVFDSEAPPRSRED